MMRQNPTDPACCSAMVGETKIPDPAIRTTDAQGPHLSGLGGRPIEVIIHEIIKATANPSLRINNKAYGVHIQLFPVR
jgi:hypothetical protein